MKKQFRFFLVCIFFLGISISFFSCKKSQEVVEKLPDPQIKAGVVKIHGKLNDPKQQVTSLILRFHNPVTASESVIEAPVEKDGSFYFETPIEHSPIFCSMYSSRYGGVLIELFFNEDKKVDLSLDSSGMLKMDNIAENALLTERDKENYFVAGEKYLEYHNANVELICEMMPEEYANHEMDEMPVRIDYAMKNLKFSNAGKIFALNELKLHYLKGVLLPYKERLEILCYNTENQNFQEPDTQYYKFLKSFDLKNPQYIYNTIYPVMMERLLTTKAFNIPLIAETPVEEWLGRVKATLSDLVGFDTGQFYDLLAANSYSMQFNNGVIPLSDKQKNNIKAYFGDGEIAKILLRENEEIIKLAEEKSSVIVNKTPEVSKEQLMNAIVSKYKNKVVLVDFWATWCGPCIDAMVRIDAIKNQLKDNGVVFVYITNGSSSKESWDKKINSISGEHYYVKADEWEYLMKSYGFTGIPSYLIFDKNGVLKNKFTSYPGNKELQVMIEKLI